jgi:hypothetical protein
MVFWNQGGRAFILIPVTVFYGSLTWSCVQAFLLYTVDKIVASLIKQVSHSFFLFWKDIQVKSRRSRCYLYLY